MSGLGVSDSGSKVRLRFFCFFEGLFGVLKWFRFGGFVA